MITTVVGTNMMEGHAFFRMEEAHEITTKINEVTMVKMYISLLNAELVHPQEEWEHTFKLFFCVTLKIVLWVQALIQQKMILVFNVCLSILDETLRLFKMSRSEHIVKFVFLFTSEVYAVRWLKVHLRLSYACSSLASWGPYYHSFGFLNSQTVRIWTIRCVLRISQIVPDI